MNFRKLFFYLCFFIFFAGYTYAYVYYIPHIHTGSDSWETYLVLDNSVNSTLDGSIYYYDQDGYLIRKENFTINPYNNKTIFLRNIGAVAAMVYTGSSNLRVRLGYIAKEDLGGGTAEFAPPTKLSKRLLMNTSNYYDKLTWSGFALWNATDKDVEIKLTAYSEERELATKTITLSHYQKIVNFFDTFFGVNSFKDIVSVTIEANYPALCGVVISGKENDKLLFSSPLMPKYYINHTEKIDGDHYATNIVYTLGDNKYHTFLSDIQDYYYHISWQDYGIKESIFENVVNYNMKIQYLAPSNDGNAIYLFGVSGDNFKVVKIDVTGDNTNEWQTVLGKVKYSTPFFADPLDDKIRGVEVNGKVYVFYKDGDNDSKGTLVNLDASNGSKLSEYGALTNTIKYGDIIAYENNNQKYFAETFAYYTDKLQVKIYDQYGNTVKEIFSQSPIPNSAGKDHVIFGTFVAGNKMIMAVGVDFGTPKGIKKYHLYLVTINLDTDTNFSNATVTDLYESLIHGSSCFMFNSYNFSRNYKNKVSYNKTLQIITRPYPYFDYENTSTTMLVHLNDDNTPVDYAYFIKKLPYPIWGIEMTDLGIYAISTKFNYLSFDPIHIITDVNIKALFGYDLLNF